MEIKLSYFPSLLRTSSYTPLRFSWCGFHEWLTSFEIRSDKRDSDPAFVPYILPHGLSRSNLHVTTLTMAVFDVDLDVTPAKVEACDDSFGDAFRVWYPSFRHTPESPRYRLIVPFVTPLDARRWTVQREEMIATHQIPADLHTSNSISHAYYVPSGPVPLRIGGNRGYVPNTVTFTPIRRQRLTLLPGNWEPKLSGTPVLELKPIIKKRIQSLRRKSDEHRADLLNRVLDGAPLADAGSRDVETTRAAAMLVYCLPDAGVEEIMDLLTPSLEAMQDAGSKLTAAVVEGKIHSAMRKRDQAKEAVQRIVKDFGNWRDRWTK